MHFPALVVTDHRPDQSELDTLLWPWCESNEEMLWPRYDYFEVGGRYRAKLDPGFSDDDPERLWDFSQKRKRDLDVTALEAHGVAKKALLYDEAHRVLAGRPVPDFRDFERRHGDREWPTHFHADPVVVALAVAIPSLTFPLQIAALAAPRNQVLATERERVLTTLAIVVAGEWHAFEGLDYDDDPAATAKWVALFHSLLSSVADDSWLTVIDCHR